MNFAVWNVRGLNKTSHQDELINFIEVNKISFMSCLETKVKQGNSARVSRHVNKKWSWVFNYEHHDNGRVWIGWDPSIWHVSVQSKSSQHITCFITFIEKQVHFCSTFVYAFNQPHQRVPLWNDLISLSQLFDIPW